MTQEERDKILRFITQNLIATLCYDFRKGHEIWEEEHLKNFYKTQKFLDKMLDKPQTMWYNKYRKWGKHNEKRNY